MAVNSKVPKAVVPQERVEELMALADSDATVAMMREIDRLSEIGLTIPEIAQVLGTVTRVSVRNLYDSKAKNAARRAVDQGCLNSLVAVAEISEIVLIELGNMKIRALAGKLDLTPEQIGTLQRAGEKAITTARILAGKDPRQLAHDKPGGGKPSSALERARQNLKAIEQGKASPVPIVNPLSRPPAAPRQQDEDEDDEDRA